MIYYFSGASYQNIKRKYNLNQLYSQDHERTGIRSLISYKKEHPEYTGKIMVDSGAFTLYNNYKKKNKELTRTEVRNYIDSYLDFIEETGDDVELFAEVDEVPDPSNMDYDKADNSWNNYLYMIEKVNPKYRDKIIPVFHFGEDFKHLKRMLEFVHDDGKHIDYIGLAISLEGTRKIRISWENTCRKIILESSNPNVKTHAFGVGVKSVLDHIDVTSTDATSWVKAAAYGMIKINDTPVTVSDVAKENLNNQKHYTNKSCGVQESVLRYIQERGYTIEQLASDCESRACFNIEDTLNWVNSLNYKQTLIGKADLGW